MSMREPFVSPAAAAPLGPLRSLSVSGRFSAGFVLSCHDFRDSTTCQLPWQQLSDPNDLGTQTNGRNAYKG